MSLTWNVTFEHILSQADSHRELFGSHYRTISVAGTPPSSLRGDGKSCCSFLVTLFIAYTLCQRTRGLAYTIS